MRACAILCWLWLIGSIRIEEPSFGTFRKAKVKGSMTDAQLESIFFYVRNDYLILNNQGRAITERGVRYILTNLMIKQVFRHKLLEILLYISIFLDNKAI